MQEEQKIQLPKLRKISLEPDNRKKILLLSDDALLGSGIATMSRELMFGTAHHYKWRQLGAALHHPEHGKVRNISDLVNNQMGISNANVVQYLHNGYGTKEVLYELIGIEKPDAIMAFTDPRFFGWLFVLEHELRTKFGIPIIYNAIWDNLIWPTWNASGYASVDLLLGISKQSHNIHREVLKIHGDTFIDLYKPTEVNAQ